MYSVVLPPRRHGLVALLLGVAAGAGVAVSAGSWTAALAFSATVAVTVFAFLRLRADRHVRRLRRRSEPLILYDALPEGREDPEEAAETRAIRLEDDLQAALAEIEALEERVRRAERRAAASYGVVRELGRLALPELGTVEAAWREVAAKLPSGFERRGRVAALEGATGRLRVAIEDLLRLAEAHEPATATSRPDRTPLGATLSAALGEPEDAVEGLDGAPGLVLVQRAALETLVRALAEQLRRDGAGPARLRVEAEPAGRGLFALRLAILSSEGRSSAGLEALAEPEQGETLEPAPVLVALARSAAERLGARLRPVAGGVRAELVVQALEDSRRAPREPRLSLAGSGAESGS